MSLSISLTVNGTARTVALDDPRVTLLDLLRERWTWSERKRAATAGNVAPARYWWMAGASIPA